MQHIDWKQIAISILVGAVVAFLTALIEGVHEVLTEYGNNALGGAASTLLYALRHRV
ncbi:hypothetical protein L0Y40_01280 [Candidatus Wolfebacteria bacterium]|nr:hypothetical protein [Candidatus Wolfebacteria bacterium]